MKKVFAMCDDEGNFIELVLLNSNNIISEEEDDEVEGLYECTYKDQDGEEDQFYYMESIDID